MHISRFPLRLLTLVTTCSLVVGCDRAERAMEEASRLNAEESYEKVIQDFPASPQASAASAALRNLRWDKVHQDSGLEEISRFISIYGPSDVAALQVLYERCQKTLGVEPRCARVYSRIVGEEYAEPYDVACLIKGTSFQVEIGLEGKPSRLLDGPFTELQCCVLVEKKLRCKEVPTTAPRMILNSRIQTDSFGQFLVKEDGDIHVQKAYHKPLSDFMGEK